MYQFRWRRECRPSLSVISAAFMALGRSYEAINRQFISTASCFTVIRVPTFFRRTPNVFVSIIVFLTIWLQKL